MVVAVAGGGGVARVYLVEKVVILDGFVVVEKGLILFIVRKE
ncbi:hypothetical protein LINGRAHAP2_LOCUS36414, partial [Linum grandiflorum]